MLSKKHYEAIAQKIKGTKSTYSKGAKLDPQYVIDDLALALCDYFEIDNPRFKGTKFLEACGILAV